MEKSCFSSFPQRCDQRTVLLSSDNHNAEGNISNTMQVRTFLDRNPVAGNVVTIVCRLEPEGDFIPEPLVDGIVLHKEDEPIRLTFVLHAGNYLPGLHDLVTNLRPGQKIDNVSLDAGWGARNTNLVATWSYTDAGITDLTQIKIGTQLVLQNGMQATVTEKSDTTFTIDANPPLAGASYTASVQLLTVEEGPVALPYSEQSSISSKSHYEVATLALGCFWGVELFFMRVRGVVGTSVGYTQGKVQDPSYEQVCTGTTGHTEAVLVMFDPLIVSYESIIHMAMDRLGENKYLLNQVGNDQGTQYRHGMYYHTDAQMMAAERIMAHYGKDCVTECKPATVFYPAEDYHQQYLLKGGQSARKDDPSFIRCYG